MTVFEAAMLLIGISVAVLAFFLVQTLRKAQTSLEAVSTTLLEVKSAVHIWKSDVDHLVGSVQKITDRADEQLSAAEPLLETVRETGEALHELAAAARGFSSIWASRLERKAREAAAKESASKANRPVKPSMSLVPVNGPGTARMEAAAAAEAGAMPRAAAGAELHTPQNGGHSPKWLDWFETGLHVAKLIVKR